MIKKISIMLFLLGNMLILKGEAAVLLEKAALNSRYFIVDSTFCFSPEQSNAFS